MNLAALDGATIYGLAAAALIGIGLFGLITDPQPIRKILAFNMIGAGVFLTFGVVARRGAAAGFGGDPIPQALVITGIVVAFSATALAVTLVQRLAALQQDEPSPETAGSNRMTEPADEGETGASAP